MSHNQVISWLNEVGELTRETIGNNIYTYLGFYYVCVFEY